MAVTVAWLFWRLSSPALQLSFSPDWWEHFSAERYQPLRHILQDEDFAFLRSQPGYSRALELELRRRRVAACRAYLKEIREDFLRLQALGQALMAAGQADASLQEQLFHQRVRFTRAWWAVRFQLGLYNLGLSRADFSGLIGALDVSASQLRPILSPAS